MTTFHAQPYDLDAQGFYFDDQESYRSKITSIKNEFGDKVEEFEIQFIDGDLIDCELCQALGVNQANVTVIMDAIDEWEEDDKTRIIIAVGECSVAFELGKDSPDDLDVDIYPDMTMRELAEEFVEEGLFGEIPDRLQTYLDYEKIARDLSMDYTETTIAGERLVYRCQ